MDPILPDSLTDYLDALLPERPAYMRAMEAYAVEQSFPIIGPQAGRYLAQMAAIQKPARIFEMGSGFGYSACWLLAGAPDAHIVCTDTSEDHADKARDWLTEAGIWEHVDFCVGDALELLRESEERFDLIYNDVDKEAYPDVFTLSLERLAPGGLLISDNVLWSGRVADDTVRDEATEAIRAYNRLMFTTPGVESVIVPIRDGLGVTRRIQGVVHGGDGCAQ